MERRQTGSADDGSTNRSSLLQHSHGLQPCDLPFQAAQSTWGFARPRKAAGPGRAFGSSPPRHGTKSQCCLGSRNSSPRELGGVHWLLNHLPVGRLQQPPFSRHHWPTPASPPAAAPPRRQEVARGRISTEAPSGHPAAHTLASLGCAGEGRVFDQPVAQGGEGLRVTTVTVQGKQNCPKPDSI